LPVGPELENSSNFQVDHATIAPPRAPKNTIIKREHPEITHSGQKTEIRNPRIILPLAAAAAAAAATEPLISAVLREQASPETKDPARSDVRRGWLIRARGPAVRPG